MKKPALDRRIGYVLIAAAIIIVSAIHLINRPAGTGSTDVDILVSSGDGPIKVANKLHKANIIRNPLYFRIILILKGDAGHIKKGLFVVNTGMSVSEIINVITSGNTKTVSITIPEGYHNRQIGDLMAQRGLFKDRAEFLEMAKNPDLLKKYNIAGPSAEGYLFPDTYEIPLDYTKEKIVEVLIKNFFDKTGEIEGMPADPKTLHRLIILASIVEREAQLDEERDLIAGVFANRIESNYPLESCATIQYHFDKPKKRLFYKDLEIKSPYNTYLNNGLPPGPIANPGIKAIKAALHPKKTEYMFFVVKNDGSHYFSKTYGEHLKAKDQYLLK